MNTPIHHETRKQLVDFANWPDFRLVCRKTCHSNTIDTPGEHTHRDFYELVIVLSGQAIHRVGNCQWPIQSASVFLIQPHQRHCYLEYDNLVIYNLLFSKKCFRFFLPDLTQLPGYQLLFNLNQSEDRHSCAGMRLKQEAVLEIFQILEEMDKVNGSITPGDKTLLLCDFIRVMLLISRNVQWDSPSPHLHQIAQINALLTHLDKHIASSWTLKKMAAFVHMSVSNFRLTFRRLTGKSPIDYLLHQRLLKAIRYMEDTSYSLEELALLCGFNNATYFTYQFKRHFGVLPSHYRREYQGDGTLFPLLQNKDS